MSGGNEKFEREFEDFLNEEDSRLAALYRKLPQDEPDARLDAAVRAMAHRALNPQLVATPRGALQRRRARWVPALGAAAGIVLAAGVAYRLGPSLHRDDEYAPASDVITVRQLDVPAPAAEPPLSPPPPAQNQNATTAPASRAAAASLQSAPAAPSAATPVAKAAELREKEERQIAQPQGSADAGVLSKTGGTKDAPAPQAFPAPARAQKRASEMDAVERKQIMAAGAWQNLHDRDADEAARDELKAKSLDDKAAAGGGAAAQAPGMVRPSAATAPSPATVASPPPPAAAAAESPAPAEYQFRTSPPSAVPGSRGDAAPAPPADATGSPRAPAAGLAKPAQAETSGRPGSNDPNAGLYPEHWLANIRTMLREGRRDDALRSLAQFRRMYPDYHLPDDLRELK